MAVQETLNAIAKTLQIVLPGSPRLEPGQALAPKITPDLTTLGVDNVLEGALSLDWLTKDVRFNGFGFESDVPPNPNAILGGMPIPSGLGTTGVPGVIGQLRGTLPLLGATKIPITAQVTWSLHANKVENGQDVPGDALTENTDFVAPLGLKIPAPTFVLKPETVELTANADLTAAAKRWLKASVKLSVTTAEGSFTSPDTPLPAVPFYVVKLPIPVVLAMFTHTNFNPLGPLLGADGDEGATLIVVPSNSPLASTQILFDTVTKLQNALRPLTSFANFVGAFLPAVDLLVNALNAQPRQELRVANKIDNMNDITLIARDAFHNNTEAEDELSSIIFVGPAGRRVQLNNDRDQDDGEGRFTLKTGPSFHAIVRNLHAKTPAVEPDVPAPDGPLLVVEHDPDDDTFGDKLSSLQFL